jgi:hypothetical protein
MRTMRLGVTDLKGGGRTSRLMGRLGATSKQNVVQQSKLLANLSAHAFALAAALHRSECSRCGVLRKHSFEYKPIIGNRHLVQ